LLLAQHLLSGALIARCILAYRRFEKRAEGDISAEFCQDVLPILLPKVSRLMLAEDLPAGNIDSSLEDDGTPTAEVAQYLMQCMATTDIAVTEVALQYDACNLSLLSSR